MSDRLGINGYCGQYFTDTGDGVRLHDIVNGQPIQPGLPAPSVLEDDCSRQGVEYLHHLGKKEIRIELVLGLHGSEERFKDIACQKAETLLSAVAVGVEMRWRSDVEKPTLGTSTLLPAKAGGFGDFHAAELRYLQEIGKPIFPCDSREGSKLSLATKEAWQLVTVEPDSPIEKKTRNRVRVIANAAVQATRHWAMLAQFGYWLSTLDKQ